MKYVLLVCGAAAALAACNKSPTVNAKNATPEEVAKKVEASGADANMVRPGLWQSKVTIEKFEIPGMPPEMAQKMKSVMAQGQVHDSQTCLTAEDVKKPKEDFFGADKSCRYDHFNMGGGKIDVAMTCKEEDSTLNTKVAGTYTSTSYSIDAASNGTGGGQNGMTMKMHVDAQRVGECTGKDD